jgi:hypothetical protein
MRKYLLIKSPPLVDPLTPDLPGARRRADKMRENPLITGSAHRSVVYGTRSLDLTASPPVGPEPRFHASAPCELFSTAGADLIRLVRLIRTTSTGEGGSESPLKEQQPTHADCLRALSRIWRRRLPTMSSSPGCMVMGRMRISSVVGRPMPKGASGVLMRASTPLIF